DLAARLAEGLKPLPGVSLVHPVDGNQVFAALPEAMASGLQADGYLFYGWDAGGISTVRLVTAFNTSADDVGGFIATAGRYVA
ncbi:MAG: low specificity L-threonine aldolase, partial [Alphaproteobacteria bacterium]